MTLIYFILMLSLITIIHEFGHFIMAKVFGVYVYEFSIGFGPKIYQKKGKETKFTLRGILLGGYVALAGEDDNQYKEENEKIDIPKQRTIDGIGPFKRILVMGAGIFMNFVLALVLICSIYLNVGQTISYDKAIIVSVDQNYPGYRAGLQVGDEIIKASFANGYSIKPSDYSELSTFLSLYDGEGNIDLVIKRNNEKLNIKVKPQFDEGEQRYLIGISFGGYNIVDVNYTNVIPLSLEYLFSMVKLMFITILGLFRGVGLNSLSGPVGVYEATSEAVSYGFLTYLNFCAVISLNIGMVNAIPLGIFDGGRILFSIIEIIIRKPVNKALQQKIIAASLILILGLTLFITYKDILKLLG